MMPDVSPSELVVTDELVEAVARDLWAKQMPSNHTGRDPAERYAEGQENWLRQKGYWRDRYLGLARDHLEFVVGLLGPQFEATYRAGRVDAAREVRAWMRGEIESWPPPLTIKDAIEGAARIAERGRNDA